MGQFSEYIKMAIYNIKENKGRSFLTMLGIIIGISSVITIISIGNGLKADVTQTQEVTSVTVQIDESQTELTNLITWDDLQALQNQLSDRIDDVIAYSDAVAHGNVTSRKGNYEANIDLTVPGTGNAEGMEPVIRGEYFDENDVANANLVCVLDKASAIYLYGNIDVVGMEMDITIENRIVTVQVIGVRDGDDANLEAAREANEMLGMGVTLNVEMPFTACENWGEEPGNFPTVTLDLREGENADSVANAACRLLNSRHLNDGDNLFKQQEPIDLSDTFGDILDGVTAFVAFVAGISLLVGGIGVMNIMLVSVTERTREIGIRKSLGAKTSSIVVQFLCESAILSGIGGIIGILTGAGIAYGISALSIGGLSAKLSLSAVMLTTGFSCGVGIIFGIYPARKAAKMSPIEALRQN